VRRLPALLLLPLLLLLSACGGEGDGQASGSGGGSGDGLDGVTVSGPPDQAPQVEVADGFSVEETTTEVVSPGEGAKVAKGATVVVNYVAVNAKTGRTFDSTYQSGQPQTFPLDSAQGLPQGIVDALVGQQAGSRVVAAVPPKALFGPQGNPQAQVGGNDTVVFVFDIEQASDPDPLEGVQGQAANLPRDLPHLVTDASGTPTGFGTHPSVGPAPDQLQVHTLIEGDGPTVESGDLLTVHYLGQIYPDGKIFDQSYSRGEPTTFQVGVGSLIPAWDKGLVGLREGSRVVLVVPPDEGYGEQGNSAAGIKGTDTLIFVVDILGVS
jgi:peptidylprolyl isomerase